MKRKWISATLGATCRNKPAHAFLLAAVVACLLNVYSSGARSADEPTPAVNPSVDAEEEDWKNASASDDPAATEAYLARYPRGRFIVEAMTWLAEVRKRRMVLKPGQELNDLFLDRSVFSDGSLKLGPVMVVVANGVFDMGDNEGKNEAEKPLHRVVITRPFAVGKYEITFDEWQLCYIAKGCEHNPSDEGMLMLSSRLRGKRPVMNVSWDDVQQYLKWIGSKTGRRYRLLTEAEWEFAARGGTTTRYSFGNDESDLAKHGWYADWRPWNLSINVNTHPVGELQPNPVGIYDMHGNVAEWVQDCMHPNYVGAPLDGSTAWTTDCVDDGARVVRGGNARDPAANLRSAFRTRSSQTTRSFGVGFRVGSDYP